MRKQLSGYPSIDKPWLKYYRAGAEERATNIPANKTVWDVIEQKLLEYKDIPAIEYFGRKISRPEFIDMVYTWAKVFKALGVKENEIVPYYGVLLPDIGAISFALNMIGACPYFIKLDITSESLAEETKEARFAIVFSDMWSNVSCEFDKDRFEKIIFVSVADAMSGIKKGIVSLLEKTKRNDSATQSHKEKYLSLDVAKEYAKQYTGDVHCAFVPNRPAFITSSSGTTVGGAVKGVIATNESALAQVYSVICSDTPYAPGLRTLNHFPPAAATSLNSLFLVPLISGATVIIDPRVSADDFYNQLVKMKPEFCINTSSLFEAFFNRIASEMKKGKTFDFSYAKGWMIGGEGTTVKKMQKWNQIMRACGAEAIYGGYGLSETFSGISIDRIDTSCDFSKPMAGVGLPQAGMTVGIFDKNGIELPYNHRGELWVKTKSTMKGYYNRPELTAKTLVDGWIHTGDIVEIDENGYAYLWGRINDKIILPNGNDVYLFDIANKIKEKEYIDDAIVMPLPGQDPVKKLVAHIVWDEDVVEKNKVEYIKDLNDTLHNYLPAPLYMFAYAEHQEMLPYSPTTLKKDKNRMYKQTTGFYQVCNGKLEEININS